MNTFMHTPAPSWSRAVQLGSTVALTIMVSLLPALVQAAPPATVATCEGIKNAYLTLGTQCANAYADVDHQPNNPTERLASFKARRTVLQIFQKTILCNGMYGAPASAQQVFKNGENGHLTALAQLRTAMTNQHDPDILPAVSSGCKLIHSSD